MIFFFLFLFKITTSIRCLFVQPRGPTWLNQGHALSLWRAAFTRGNNMVWRAMPHSSAPVARMPSLVPEEQRTAWRFSNYTLLSSHGGRTQRRSLQSPAAPSVVRWGAWETSGTSILLISVPVSTLFPFDFFGDLDRFSRSRWFRCHVLALVLCCFGEINFLDSSIFFGLGIYIVLIEDDPIPHSHVVRVSVWLLESAKLCQKWLFSPFL